MHRLEGGYHYTAIIIVIIMDFKILLDLFFMDFGTEIGSETA